MNRTLVIGATGNIGSQVVRQLAASGGLVRAMTRDPGTARFAPGIEVVKGDITLPEMLDGCFDEVDAVFLVWTAGPATMAPVVDRMAKKVRHVVFLSSPHQTAHPFFQQPNRVRGLHEEMERLIAGSGMEWRFLRPGMLAVNSLSWWAPQIRKGDVVRWPLVDCPTAPIHERDIAAVAVRVLCEKGHHGAEYVLTGPQSLSQAGQIHEIGRALGRRLRVEEITPGEAREELTAIMPPFIIEMLLAAWGAGLGQPAFVTSTVEELLGVPARSFYEWARDHAARFAV